MASAGAPPGAPVCRTPDDPPGSLDCFVQVPPIQLDPHEIYAEQRTGDRGAAEAQERIGDDAEARQAVEAEAEIRQPDRERRWMRPVLVPVLNGVVGEEPGVPAASPSATRPACQRVTFDWSWYATPSARRSSGVRPEGEKWKMNSWQSLTNLGLLIGL